MKMRIELIVIGSEVLCGSVCDLNTETIALTLSKAGYTIVRQTTVIDDVKAVTEVLKEAFSRADIVLTTGGLGSTVDDVTRQAITELLGGSFTPKEEIKNYIGIASGLVICPFKKTLIALPGVPSELESMMKKGVLEYLSRNFPIKKGYYRDHFSLLFKQEQEVDPLIRRLQEKFPEFLFGIYPDNPIFGILTVSISSEQFSKEEFLIYSLPILEEMKNLYPSELYRTPTGLIEEALHLHFVESNQTLAFAESCTGGVMSQRVTKFPGASRYFLGSLVTYSNELKEEVLGVAEETLLDSGAVSDLCVKEMVEGLFYRTKADWAVAVSGIMGPTGGSIEKPVGTVYYAIAKQGIILQSGLLPNSVYRERETLMQISATHLFGYLWRLIHDHSKIAP
jgi:nicotinamide-nucleotide amidase